MKVLFICSGNAHRSPLAEALLRKLKPDWIVDSAGISVAIPIAEEIKEYLQGEDALEYLKSKPESVNSKQLMKYDLIIAMEDKHKEYVLSLRPECKDKIKVWNVKDPDFMDKENTWKIYEQIKEKIIEMAESSWVNKIV